MKKIYAIMMMAATLAACSREQQAVTEEPDVPQGPDAFQTYTLTVKASKGDDATTRAVGLSTDGTAINASWKQGDEVVVTNYLYIFGTLTAQSDGAETTLTGTLTVPQEAELKKGDQLDLLYNLNADFTAAQDGTLKFISDHLDMASCQVTVDDIDESGHLTIQESSANFENIPVIVRLHLVDKADGTTPLMPSALTVELDYDNQYIEHNVSLSGMTAATFAANAYGGNNGDGVVYVALPQGFESKTVSLSATVDGDTFTYTKTGVTFAGGQFYDIKVKMTRQPKTFNLSTATADVTLRNGDTATGTMTGHTLWIADGATVTLSGASVTAAVGPDNGPIRCLGDATIILADGTENVANSSYSNEYSAVHWPAGKTLTIRSGTDDPGKLTADSNYVNSGDTRAGIGGGLGHPCGNLVIEGGIITAKGGNTSAGIGAACYGDCGDITISGGNVTATGGSGAGIGAGEGSGSAFCGKILINGGIVTATGGSSNAAGIGHGDNTYSAKSVTITDGITRVTATRGSSNSGVRCIGDKMNGSATIDGERMSDYFEDLVDGAPTFPNLNFAERDDYKNATTWTLTHK